MPILKTSAKSERGSIIIMTLMIFLIISVLGTTIVELGIMEYKTSRYELESQQARQAADAGVDWSVERIYSELSQPDNLIIEKLPTQLNCSNGTTTLAVGEESCAITIGNVKRVDPETMGDSCTYEFISAAIFEGARRAVQVRVIYNYSGGYDFPDSEGNLSFMPRTYLNRGKIISCETIIM